MVKARLFCFLGRERPRHFKVYGDFQGLQVGDALFTNPPIGDFGGSIENNVDDQKYYVEFLVRKSHLLNHLYYYPPGKCIQEIHL